MRILFLSRWFPYPPDNGSKLRVYNLIKGISRHHEIGLLSFVEPSEGADVPRELQALCSFVETVPRRPFDPYSRRSIAGFFSPLPRSVLDTYSEEMTSAIQRLMSQKAFDLILASQRDTAVYGRFFRGVPAVFEEVELAGFCEAHTQAGNLLSRFRSYLTWLKEKRFLRLSLSHFKACTVVSEVERSLLMRSIPGTPPVEVIPNCVDVNSYKGFENETASYQMIFTGSFRYRPNHDAMTWFVREVLPEVRKSVPESSVVITGDPDGLRLPSGAGVSLLGHVPDVRPLVASSWVSLAPLFRGGGTRLKILEAMALGTPVVATSKGAEGLTVTSGDQLLIADSAGEFAAALVRILQDPALRCRLRARALELVRACYDWPAVLPGMLGLLERAVSR